MPVETVYALGASNITISGGQQLSGFNQGDGSHLVHQTIILENNNWEAIDVFDTEASFDDSDNSQSLEGQQSFDGSAYGDGLRVEAEYSLLLEDADGNQYTVIGFNINEPGVTSYSTVEGLAFVGGEGGFPPQGVELRVVSATEGPRADYDSLATPPCFTRGCLIETESGVVPIEALRVGDRVKTAFNGVQTIRWVGVTHLPGKALQLNEKLRPIRIVAGALGRGMPERDLVVSRQHRVVVSSQIVERMFGLSAILIPAHRLCGLPGISVVTDYGDVDYFHLLFDHHEVVYSEGAPTESLHTGIEARKSIPADVIDEVLSLFPELDHSNQTLATALPLVSPKQEKAVIARHFKNAKPVLDRFPRLLRQDAA